MRKSILSLIIVGALAGWAAPGLAAARNTQQSASCNAPKPGPEFLSSRRAWTTFASKPGGRRSVDPCVVRQW